MNMKPLKEEMRVLIGLQTCDMLITDIRSKKDNCPVKIRELKKGLEEAEKQAEEAGHRLGELKRERRQAEQDVEEMEGRIEKSNGKLSSVKSNKEYRAALKEIEDLKKEKMILEDRILELMEQMDSLEEDCSLKKSELETSRKKFEEDESAILKEIKALDEEIQKLEQQRSSFCQTVDKALLNRYDFLRERKQNIAVSPVVKGVCQTCHMDIPPQLFNEVIRGDDLIRCPNCSRIVYWGEDEMFQDPVDVG